MNPKFVGKLRADIILRDIGMTNGNPGIDKDEVPLLREKINSLKFGNSGNKTSFARKIDNVAKSKELPFITADAESTTNKCTLEHLEKALEEAEKKYGIPSEKYIIYV